MTTGAGQTRFRVGSQHTTRTLSPPSLEKQPFDPSVVQRALQTPGHALDDSTMATMGNRFGRDFSQVHVHDDAVAARSAHAIDADGYAVGSDVVLRSYDPQSAHGERLIAHELAHVAQHDRRDSASALQLDDPQSEAERDATRRGRRRRRRTRIGIRNRRRRPPLSPRWCRRRSGGRRGRRTAGWGARRADRRHRRRSRRFDRWRDRGQHGDDRQPALTATETAYPRESSATRSTTARSASPTTACTAPVRPSPSATRFT